MITVRPASAADVPAIVAIHCADIVTWRRWDAAGNAVLANYADLRPYERWLNGGPWMDTTTYAPYLARWTAPGSGGLALVAERDGQVLAMAEAMAGDEPPPFGRNLNISVLYALRGHTGQGLGSALMQALEAHGRALGCDTLAVGHAEAPAFYARHGLRHTETWRRAGLPARTSQTQYAAEPAEARDYGTVAGWAMPIGRYQSARQEWERLQPGAEPDFPEWRGLRRERWRLTVRRAPAVLVLDEAPRQPGAADVHLWLPPGHVLSRQLLAAVRDRAARSGFEALRLFVNEGALPALGHGWHDDGYKQQVWLRALNATQPLR
jgi:GNAT superfamily N-acetyltransferase